MSAGQVRVTPPVAVPTRASDCVANGSPRGAGGRSRRQDRGLRPTRGPFGDVPWWQRPPPGGHEALWNAVKRLQRRRLQLDMSVTHLAERMARLGHPVSRETLSRVLNGKQPTSWAMVAGKAEALSADVPELPDEH